MRSNFDFLRDGWPDVADSAVRAERFVHADPRSSCFYTRRALELAVAWLYKHDPALKLPYQDNLSALVHDPTILLLDEPFNGMDPRQRLHMMDLLRSMAAAGRTILFSSHILEEVERLADGILVIYAGRLAAAGDFREIRQLMTDRPHTFVVRSSDDRRLAAAFMLEPAVFGAELRDDRLTIRVTEFAGFTRIVARVARDARVSLFEVAPTDDSLESVFEYLVSRR